MIFARHIKSIDDLNGKFIIGRIYLADAGGSGGTTGALHVIDDEGTWIKEDVNDFRFDYLQEVFAAVVKEFDEYGLGEVVVVSDARVNGNIFYNVAGDGFYRAEMMTILDRTNVGPGTSVLDASGKWVAVRAIDECMWLRLDEAFRAPSEFRFAVSSDGDILNSPMMLCVNGTGLNLTSGNMYQILSEFDGRLVIEDDAGERTECLLDRFEIV